jgi:cytidylate kinase
MEKRREVMAIITVSSQYGSHGETIARETAAQLSFEMITPETVSGIMREKYQLDFSLTGEIALTPRERESGKLFANLISAILTDKAVLNNLVILESGGQFIFRSFPNALHIRIIASREIRAQNTMQDKNIDLDEASKKIEECDRRHERFLRASFRRSSEMPERYDLCINTGKIGIESAVELIISAARLKKIGDFGMVSDETIERLKLRNQIRLQKALTNLILEKNRSLTDFAHASELVFARLLDFYGIPWEYEPRTFPLRRDANGSIIEAFTPDFYLPDSDLFVELTTMKQSLVTKKNRKVKLLQELYPDLKIRLLYQKDMEDLLFKYTAKTSEPSGKS